MTESIEQIQQQARPADLPEVLRHYIGGEFVDSLDGETFDVLDPVTNRPYIRAASGKKADVDAAVAAAKEAFEHGPWPGMLPRGRSRVLHRIADIVESRGEALAAMESYDSGLPITQALGQARRAAENFRFFADLIVAQHDDAFKVPGRQVNYVNRKPKGVAGLITPWNTPPSPPATPWCSSPPRSPRCPRPCGRGSSRRPGCPSACSTWSTGSARRVTPGTRWSGTRTSR